MRANRNKEVGPEFELSNYRYHEVEDKDFKIALQVLKRMEEELDEGDRFEANFSAGCQIHGHPDKFLNLIH